MKILRDTDNLPDSLKGAVYAIGNFDGIHQGHRAVIKQAAHLARQNQCAHAIISFEPHARSFFRPDLPQARLTPMRLKAELMQKIGVDFLINLRFNQKLADLSAENFVQEILHKQLTASHIVVGENFRFGAKRAGDAVFLAQAGKKIGFSTDIIKPIRTKEGSISSTAIRAALKEGQTEKAARLLGRWWQIAGRVRRGDQRGQKLGFPTLNLALKNYAPLALGVYAARCQIKNKIYDAVINIGLRPTFGAAEAPLLEAHLFGAAGDFYGATARVFPLHFIRAEKRFDGESALKAQIKKDCAAAQKICQDINIKDISDFFPE